MKLLYILILALLSLKNIISVDKKANVLNLNAPLIQPITQTLNNKANLDSNSYNSLKNGDLKLKNMHQKPVKDNSESKIKVPTTHISNLSTEIFISKNKCSALIKETALFTISNGVFNSITRRISLDGSADSISGFKLASSDVILKEAKIIKNCYHDNSIIDHPYICIVAVFEEENLVDKSKVVEIEYDYLADNILKSKRRPFSTDIKQEDNVMIWIYDNFQNSKPINKVNLKIHFDEKINSKEILTYPEKYFKKNKDIYTDVIEWEKDEITANSYQNFSFHIPKFNKACRNLNEIHFEFSYYSLLQFFMCILILLIFIFVIILIYINEKEKTETIKLNEEIDTFKRLKNEKSDCSESNNCKAKDRK